MLSPRFIPNAELRAEKIPDANASWSSIERFALTFDGYKYWGSSEACAEVANAQRRGTLTELRTCIFFEQRRWKNQGEMPDAVAMHYIQRVMTQIRHRVRLANDLLA